MLTMYDIFNSDTINIFTDGSIYKNLNTGETIGSTGALIMHGSDFNTAYLDNRTGILRNTTNNETEIESVLLGLKLASDYIRRTNIPYHVNLFSDSKICIVGLREWMFNWIKCTYSGVLYNSSGSPVMNQETFKSCVSVILESNMNVSLYHQKGHVANSDASIQNAIKVFKELNGDSVDSTFIKTVSYFNNFVDIFTKNDLKKRINNKEFDTLAKDVVAPFILDPAGMDMNKYKYLISKK